MTAAYDAIVLGVGGMGAAALFELARRGRRVLGLDRFRLGHARGSSHGHTRIIRTAYYEHPAYVPLVRRAYAGWYDLEQRAGRHLLTGCPCLSVGPPDSGLIQGVRRSAREHGLPVDDLSAADVRRAYPAFRVPDSAVGVREADAGFLLVEECVRAHVEAAVGLGAEVRGDEPVREWKPAGGGVEVRTDAGTYHAGRLVVTAGAWAADLLAGMGVPLTVMRQVLFWFAAGGSPAAFRRDGFPIFIADTPGGYFYGLPAVDRFGVKVARHYGAPELPGPAAVSWDVTAADEAPVRGFLDAYLPAAGPATKAQVCMYTLTPDRHFVLDAHPRHPQVVAAAGFSGHGYKFAPVVGEVLADLAEAGRTTLPTDLFRQSRA